jgi:tRNA (mo5U34)-methyltransferase
MPRRRWARRAGERVNGNLVAQYHPNTYAQLSKPASEGNPSQNMPANLEAIERAKALRWFHSIDLGGYVTQGEKSLARVEFEQRITFEPVDLSGATVLDIGAWSGAFSFAAKRRGATRVMATDHFAWTHLRGRETFDIARAASGLNIEARDIDVTDLNVTTVGKWDVVLFLGVLYHLPAPLPVLEAVAEIATDCLIVETRTEFISRRPALIYHPGCSLLGDCTNHFTPNLAFMISALRECGFPIIDWYVKHDRLTLHAWRKTARRKLGNAQEHSKGRLWYYGFGFIKWLQRLKAQVMWTTQLDKH